MMMNINAVERILAHVANEAGVRFTYIDMPMTMTNGNLELMSDADIKAKVEFIDDRVPKALAAALVVANLRTAFTDALMSGVRLNVNISLSRGTVRAGFNGNEFISMLDLHGKIGRHGAAGINDAVEQGIADVFKRSIANVLTKAA